MSFSTLPPKRVLSVFSLVMINVIAVDSIRTLPLAATYGLSLLTLYLIGALLFFIPTALISAELATTWPMKGGMYVWVKEAFGARWGFLVVYLQWIYNIVWYPTILSLVAGTLAYLFDPELVNNKTYMAAMVLTIFWASTVVNFLGMKMSSWISTLGSLIGTMLPMLLIIGCAGYWLFSGQPSNTELSYAALIPQINSLPQLVFFSAILYSLLGLEMSSVHALEVKNPESDYPKALLISALIVLVSLTLSSVAVAIVVPKAELNIVAGIIQAFSLFLKAFNLTALTPIIALIIVIGGICQVATWIIGPTKGLWAAVDDGYLPKILSVTNKKNVPINMLIAQAIICTFLSLTFVLLPTVKSSYWALSAMAAQLSLIMYAILFAAAIRLRYNRKDVYRPFKIPFGNIGVWVIAGSGFVVSVLVTLLGFIPPEDVPVGNIWIYEGILFSGMAIILIPFFLKKNPVISNRLPS